MTQRLRQKQYSLSRQIVFPIVALVILTAIAVGLPAIALVNNQLEQQAQARVDQGLQTTHILITNKLKDLSYLAVLTAQRPTLQRLVRENDLSGLGDYLEVFRQGASLDAVLLCEGTDEIIKQVGESLSVQACKVNEEGIVGEAGIPYHGWMLVSQPIPESRQDAHVVVGNKLDNDFASQLREETGMEQTLLYSGNFLAASFPEGSQVWQSATTNNLTSPSGLSRYYSLRKTYSNTGLETIVSLPGTEFIQARRMLNLVISGSIAVVIILGSALGVIRARQISHPLERLRDTADNLRHGDLVTPVRIETSVRELALLSYVLDDARTTLNHTINELRDEKAWTDHLLESVIEGIITLDRNKYITFFSHGAENISGWEQDEVLFRPVDEIFPLYKTEGSFSQHLPTPGSKQVITIQNRNGKPSTLAITGASLAPPESGKGATVLVLRDVSSEESIHRLLGDFLANITHEFRTPLSALAASSELLLDQLPDLEQDELANLLNNLHLGILNLQTLIDNLLEAASIETGRFKVFAQPIELPAILREAVDTMMPLASKYSVEIEIRLPSEIPPILADARRTTQVILNLLSNAIKWGSSGGSITVSASRSDDFIEVCIADRGPGVPDDQQASLFHPFSKVEPGARLQQGTGLGLSVVKAIVEAQGGNAGMRNRLGGGSEFWFTLQQAQTQPEREI